jgi:hypothetical protein
MYKRILSMLFRLNVDFIPTIVSQLTYTETVRVQTARDVG